MKLLAIFLLIVLSFFVGRASVKKTIPTNNIRIVSQTSDSTIHSYRGLVFY